MNTPARKLLAALAATVITTACATISPPKPPSLDLPRPPKDLRAVRQGERITLTWSLPTLTTDRETIRVLGPTRICRSVTDLQNCGTPAGQLPAAPTVPQNAKSKDKPKASYTDTLPAEMESDNPDARLTYAVEILNQQGRSAGLSNHVTVPLIRALPPPQDFQTRVTNQGVVLSWTGDQLPSNILPNVKYVYRIYRTLDGGPRELVGEMSANSDQAFSLTDSRIEWQKTYEYHAETVTVISEPGKSPVEVEGDETSALKAFAEDVFPPAVPTGLQAVFSGPAQQRFIDLIWAPVPDVDLAGYNVYRRTQNSAPMKLNSEPLKSPAYRDPSVEAGLQYFYSVSSVDLRGNESARSSEAQESVPQ